MSIGIISYNGYRISKYYKAYKESDKQVLQGVQGKGHN
jgi:hypothetical protein